MQPTKKKTVRHKRKSNRIKVGCQQHSKRIDDGNWISDYGVNYLQFCSSLINWMNLLLPCYGFGKSNALAIFLHYYYFLFCFISFFASLISFSFILMPSVFLQSNNDNFCIRLQKFSLLLLIRSVFSSFFCVCMWRDGSNFIMGTNERSHSRLIRKLYSLFDYNY